ncbi:hypothetical protein ABK669_01095 [Enterobacter hormaechei]|uniref:hypothetical protein n=1 Tax=Enterobacter hormaechei TaxID=158836 RepID=UPI00375390DB
MSTLTKEWLLKTIAELEEERDATPGVVNEDAAMALAAMKLALASLEAEPVAWRYRFVHTPKSEEHGSPFTTDWVLAHSEDECNPSDCFERQPLYIAPPEPVSVPDAISTRQAIAKMENHEPCDSINVAYKFGWNACRAAMLQGAEPVTTDYKLPVGWVAVPVEPTEDMIVNGFESEPDESFSDEKEWEEYDAMSGCQQAAHRAKLCWAAMIAAAPQQEVK